LISLGECTEALEKMKGNKSPGLDGIGIEFYTKFWDILGPKLVDVFNESYNKGILSNTQRKSIITLIFKNGEMKDIANYRPISVTNIDYKILAMVLVNRLQRVIGTLIGTDQSAYIKGRNMGTNIRLVYDMLHLSDRNIGGLLMSIDFRKAFDTLEHKFLFKVLHWFGFGESFIKWIHTLYNSPNACVKNNGHQSSYFDITRGIRQGCPISAVLFDLCVEILSIKVRSDNRITGFSFGNQPKKIKVLQYADDTIFFLKNEKEINDVMSIVENYATVSGLNLNRTKCEGYWFGKDKHRQDGCQLHGIKWPNQIKYLGIYLGYDRDLNDKMNWSVKIEKIKKILGAWETRDLSLIGRIQIIKSLAISQLSLQFSTLTVPEQVISNLNSILYKFLWKSKDKIKRIKMIRNVKNGGLNMIDLECYADSLKAMWINRIVSSNPDSDAWVQIPIYYFNKIGIDANNLRYNFDNTVEFHDLKKLPYFYQRCIISYNKAHVTNYDDFIKNIAHQPVWGNKFITTKGCRKKNVLHFRNWIRSGVRNICDLRFTNGVLDEDFMYNKIANKCNVLIEIRILRRALLAYRAEFQNIAQNGFDTVHDREHGMLKAKHIYDKLLETKTMNVHPISNYIAAQEFDSDENNMFSCKINNETEMKLKEFNFKLLHGFLPCKVNLKRWRISDDDKCDVCDLPQSIRHLLFDCYYVQPLWSKVNNLFNINVSFALIMGTDSLFYYNRVLTLVSFLIYKEWLVLSLESKCRTNTLSLMHFKAELELRCAIYRKCKFFREKDVILFEQLAHHLGQ
jgi:hypothetical protein